MKNLKIFILAFFIMFVSGCINIDIDKSGADKDIVEIVNKHAKAWETGDLELLDSLLHEDVVFAYPGRRLNKQETLKDLAEFDKSFKNTKIYINEIIIEGDDVAVEWQFASTNIETGKRTAVSDAIIGKIKDGQILVWKEYLDGRVSRMQTSGELPLEEGQEPFPWPKKSR
tara:strand:+ start:47382 stop:47894 length:513 start_codon:yes stop_codon:yes gene_type:complete